MFDPTPYSVSYSFSGYQALNPNRPLPASAMDVKLSAIEASLDSTITALADVRRSDSGPLEVSE